MIFTSQLTPVLIAFILPSSSCNLPAAFELLALTVLYVFLQSLTGSA